MGVMAVLAGLLMMAGGLWYWRRGEARHARASATWIRGEATILAAECREVTTSDREGRRETGWRPVVSYAYEAEGQSRKGTRPFLHAIPDYSRRKSADAWLAGHAVGSRTPVWYNRAAPDEAALELNKPSAQVVIVFLALGLALAGFRVAMLLKGA